jgi:phosphate transport system ATP-binding protein
MKKLAMIKLPTALCAPKTAAVSRTLMPIIAVSDIFIRAGERSILQSVSFAISANEVFGILGPSGVGKSTLLKCLNRLIDLTPSLRVSGNVAFHGESIFRPDLDVDALRARIGMIFQQPVVFPTSILKNAIFGLRHVQHLSKSELIERAEKALREAALWNEVKDRLLEPAMRLSVGQQQRLCLARTLALDPEVILMDEPTSALDHKSTEAIEQLILTLKKTRTIVLVTHNLGQSDRVCDAVLSLTPSC